MAVMLSMPNLMPNCSSPNSQASESDSGLPFDEGLGLGNGFGRRSGDRRCAHEAESSGDCRLHLAPIDDLVEHPFLEQELRTLESFRQLLPDRLLDDAPACEAHQRL